MGSAEVLFHYSRLACALWKSPVWPSCHRLDKVMIKATFSFNLIFEYLSRPAIITRRLVSSKLLLLSIWAAIWQLTPTHGDYGPIHNLIVNDKWPVCGATYHNGGNMFLLHYYCDTSFKFPSKVMFHAWKNIVHCDPCRLIEWMMFAIKLGDCLWLYGHLYAGLLLQLTKTCLRCPVCLIHHILNFYWLAMAPELRTMCEMMPSYRLHFAN